MEIVDPLGLRQALHDALNAQASSSTHEREVTSLIEETSHSIRLVPIDDSWMPSALQYSCFEFALDLINSRRYRQVFEYFRRNKLVDSDTIHSLRTAGALKRLNSFESARDGDLVLYYTGEDPEETFFHAGKVRGSRVISKCDPRGLI